jgi:Zn finger protein HypA/HybF involved in hydrogenase expression
MAAYKKNDTLRCNNCNGQIVLTSSYDLTRCLYCGSEDLHLEEAPI